MQEENLLHRLVNPAFVQGDSISSQVFKPTSKDEGLLSLYNGNQFSADESYQHYTSKLNLESVAVASISRIEFEELTIEVEDDNIPFIGHSSANFNSLSTSQVKKAAKKLKNLATSRGVSFY